MKETKPGSIVLLAPEHSGAMNPFGKPVVGWIPTSEGVGGLVNRRGFAVLRVVVQNGDDQPMYDQPMIVENAGAIVIAQTPDGRIGLVRNFRMTGERLISAAGSDYVNAVDTAGEWGILVKEMGQWSWEAPRGIISGETIEDPVAFAIKTAKIEAAEEAGLTIGEARVAGRVNPNSTFFMHPQYVVHGRVESVGNSQPEDSEMALSPIPLVFPN